MKIKINFENIENIFIYINKNLFYLLNKLKKYYIWIKHHKYFLFLIFSIIFISFCTKRIYEVKLPYKIYKCEVIDRSEYNNNKYLILQETTNNRIFKLNVTDSAYYLSYKNKYLYFNLLDNEIDPDIINPADNYVAIIVLLFMLLLVFTIIKIADIF